MTNAEPTPRTASDHAAHLADAAPQFTLVPPPEEPTTPPTAPEQKPDAAIEQHPKAEQETCGATRWQQGHQLVCELELMHPGYHQHGERGWRRSSGDVDFEDYRRGDDDFAATRTAQLHPEVHDG